MYGTTSFPRKRMARNSSPMARDRISFRRFLFAVTMNASGSRMLFEPRENAYTLCFYESGVELVQSSQTVVPPLSLSSRARCPWEKLSMYFFQLQNIRLSECYAPGNASSDPASTVSTGC